MLQRRLSRYCSNYFLDLFVTLISWLIVDAYSSILYPIVFFEKFIPVALL